MKNFQHHVDLSNNPYLQRLSILIDDKNIPPYSDLYQYMNASFVEWCDCILDKIAEHLNGEHFMLTFSSSMEEMLVMQTIAMKNPYCDRYISKVTIRDIPTATRLKKLHQLIREKKIQGYEFQKLNALFVLDGLDSLKDELLNLDVKNSFCTLQTDIMSLKDYNPNHTHELFFAVTAREISDDLLKIFRNEEGFLIQISEENPEPMFNEKIGRLFAFQTNRESLFQTIFICLLLFPLVRILRNCIASIPTQEKDSYKKILNEIQSTTASIIPIVESTTLEVGRSVRIRFDSDLKNQPVVVENLSYAYSRDGIVNCNGFLVEGIRPGSCTMYIIRAGESVSCAEVEFKVIQRNRIQEIFFDEDIIYVGENTERVINFSVQPSDADNLDKITWESTNPEIATIDRCLLKARRRGACTIRCIAENVSAKFHCEVRPFLTEIIVDTKNLEIPIGEKIALEIRTIPENSIDGKLFITSMDMRVANVVGREVQGIGKGKTRIVIENISRTIREEISVEVFKKDLLSSVTRSLKKNIWGG